MIVHVLTGVIEYENTDVLGVYSTKELADQAVTAFKTTTGNRYDSFEIIDVVTDAPPIAPDYLSGKRKINE